MDCKYSKGRWLAIATSLGVSVVNAEQLFDETALFDHIPAVISASRVEQPAKDLPVSITVIDRALIDASGAIKVSDLFRLVPGMLVQAYNSTGAAVSYHGIRDVFPRRLEVMVNGRAVYWPLLSTVDWGSLGVYLDDIDHIEVVRGSNTPTNGANAFLGSVNIVTRNPLSNTGSSVSSRIGSQQSRQLQFRHADQVEELRFRISANVDRASGSKALSDKEINRGFSFQGELTPTLTDTIDIELGGTWGQVDWEGIAVDGLFVPRDYNYDYQLLRWTHEGFDGFSHQWSLYRNYLNLDAPEFSAGQLAQLSGISESFAASVLALNPGKIRGIVENGQTEIRDIEYQLSGHINQRTHIVSGLGYRQSLGRSPVILDRRDDLTEERWRLFNHLEYQPLQPLRLTFGVMAEKGNEVENFKFSPRLAANYQPMDDLSFRTSYTRAYRIPSMLAFNAELDLKSPLPGPSFNELWRPNKSLVAERLNAFDIGLLKQWDHQMKQLDIRLFREQVDNAIDAEYIVANDLADQVASIPENGGHWRQRGIEMQFRMRPLADDLLAMTYSYVKTQGALDKGILGVEELAGNFPDHSLSLLYSHRVDTNWSIGASHYFVASSMNWDGKDTGAVRRTDLKISYQAPLSGAEWRADLIVQNLFDQDNRETSPGNILDRVAYLNLKLNF